MSELQTVLAAMEREIHLFDGVIPGSGNIELQEEVFEEKSSNGKSKVIVQKVLKPSIIPFIPKNCNGMAVIIMPGGGHRRMVMYREGIEVANWLNSKGIAAFVLKYRLTIDPHERQEDVSLIDAMRAVRYIRYHASEYHIDAKRIGVMGFSAGGYLAALISNCYDRKLYERLDSIDDISARPDFSVLCYPAISAEVAMKQATSKNPELVKVMGKNIEGISEISGTGEGIPVNFLQYIPESIRYRVKLFGKYSIEKLVHKDTPKTFIIATSDDETTPIEHSLSYYMALRKYGVLAEMHIFENGKHGFGIGQKIETGDKKKTVGAWTELFLNWAESKGLLAD